MDFIINLFWFVVTIAIYLGGAFLVCGLVSLIFCLIYKYVWQNTFANLSCFQSRSEDDELVNICFCCALVVVIAFAFYDGSAQTFIEEIKNIFA